MDKNTIERLTDWEKQVTEEMIIVGNTLRCESISSVTRQMLEIEHEKMLGILRRIEDIKMGELGWNKRYR